MILSKDELVELIVKEKIIEDAVDLSKQLQPAGVDLTLNKVFSFESKAKIGFDDEDRKKSECKEIAFGEDDWIELKKGVYKIRFNELARVPKDLAAVTFCRSSLARSGCDVYNGFWDPGYEGKGESILVVGNEHGLKLKKNARIAQLVFFKLGKEALDGYKGMHYKENI